eukprot:4398914-Amphidinium_carterae.1
MVNIGVDADTHRDVSNVTFNDVLVLGEFSEGHLVAEFADGEESLQLADGSVIQGKRLAAKPNMPWITFDATRWHRVERAQGLRVSVVLFCVRGLHRLSCEDWCVMEEKGFDVTNLKKVANAELEVQTPGKPLDLCELRRKLGILGLLQCITLGDARSAVREPVLKTKRERRKRRQACRSARVITDLLAGRDVHLFQLMSSLPFSSLPSDF